MPDYQVFPRSDLEDVLAGIKDGGEHLSLIDAQRRAADLTGTFVGDVAAWWRARDRRTGQGRVYVSDRRGRSGYIIAPAMPRVHVGLVVQEMTSFPWPTTPAIEEANEALREYKRQMSDTES